MIYEYRLVPSPTRAEKTKGVKTGAGRLAHTVEAVINAQARDGWQYLRADVLPAQERQGLTGKATVYHTVLVFQRPVAADGGVIQPAPEPEFEPPIQTAPVAPTDNPDSPDAALPPARED